MSTEAAFSFDTVVLETVDSTMAEAARRAPDLVRPTWILALDQTAARGRRGRPWRHPKGNFAATLVFRPTLPVEQIALTSFQAALALYDTMARYVDPARLALKWPNDVLLDGGKAAGILLESGAIKTRVDWVMVGIGVNLAAAPAPDMVEPQAIAPVFLSTNPPSPEEFLSYLAPRYAELGQLWHNNGFEALRRLWLERAARLGEPITARLPHEEITGIFDTVDPEGYLVLRTASGTRKIAAAEVYF